MSDAAAAGAPIAAILAQLNRVILGKQEQVRLCLACLLARGHLLIEDIPGVGKTMLATAMAKSLDCSMSRIQLTPDLMRLRQLTSDNPVQGHLLDEMIPLCNQRIEEFRNTIALARAEHVDDAARIIREGIGRDAMSHIDDLARHAILLGAGFEPLGFLAP